MPAERRNLVRALTLVPAAAVILANIIGTGVFVKARVMTCNVGSAGMVLVVWLAAGLLSLAGALVYAELGTMMPRAGGEYAFLDAAYGRRWAFLYGWSRTLVLGASVAASALLTAMFFNGLCGDAMSQWQVNVAAAAILAVGAALNLASVHASGWTSTAMTVIKVTLVVFVAGSAFVLADGDWSHFAESGAEGLCEGVPATARGGAAGFGAAMLAALWGYNGWNVIANLGGEVRDPSRTMPRALIGGTAVVILLYLLANAAYFYVLSPAEVASVPESSSVAQTAANRYLGPSVAALMSAGLMLSAFGTMHAVLLTGSRLPFALAADGLLPSPLARLSARGVPWVAVVAVSVWGIVLSLSGTFDVLTDIYVFVLWIFYGLTGAALLVLRRRDPGRDRPFRVPGYPWVPMLFLLVTTFLLVSTLVAKPQRGLTGFALIVSGLPIYWWFGRRRSN